MQAVLFGGVAVRIAELRLAVGMAGDAPDALQTQWESTGYTQAVRKNESARYGESALQCLMIWLEIRLHSHMIGGNTKGVSLPAGEGLTEGVCQHCAALSHCATDNGGGGNCKHVLEEPGVVGIIGDVVHSKLCGPYNAQHSGTSWLKWRLCSAT